MEFLKTPAGKQLVATGKFNTTGLLLVEALPVNVQNVTVSVNQFANQINRGVRVGSRAGVKARMSIYLMMCGIHAPLQSSDIYAALQ